MHIVSENPDDDLRRKYATDHVGWALRELAANLLRVTRGAGKPYLVGPQAAELVRKFEAYRDTHGHYPPADVVSEALSLRDPEMEERLGDHSQRMDAERQMVNGALQIAASKLLGQRTQETAGGHELYTGLNEIWAQRRAESLAREKANAQTSAPKAKAKARRKSPGEKTPPTKGT